MVGFHHQHVGGADLFVDFIGDGARIRHHRDFRVVLPEGEAQRLTGIVGKGKTLDLNVSDSGLILSGKIPQPVLRHVLELVAVVGGAPGGDDLRVLADAGHHADALHVVHVLVGHQNSGDGVLGNVGVRQSRADVFAAEAHVQKQVGGAVGD